MTKIVLADDHDMVRMGLARMLSDVQGYEVVGEAKTGEEAVLLVKKHSPDVVLMDIKMPGMGGVEATRKILSYNSEVRVIAVTSQADDLYPERLLKAGAKGYVTKDEGFDEMNTAIRAVMTGQSYMSGEVARRIALKNCGGPKSPFEALSERELQTAILIANGSKVQTIADSFCVSPKTINSYRYRIFEKLNVNSDVELTLMAVKHKILDIDTID